MWILKGVLLGLAIFFVGSLLYVLNEMRPFDTLKATGLSALKAWTVANPWYWLAFIVALAVGCAIMWFRQRPPVAK